MFHDPLRIVVYGNGTASTTEHALRKQDIVYERHITVNSCKANCLGAWRLLGKTGGIVMPDDLILTSNFIEKLEDGIANYEAASLFSLEQNPPWWYFCGMGIYFSKKYAKAFANFFEYSTTPHDAEAAMVFALKNNIRVKHFIPTLTEHVGDISRANPGMPIRASVCFIP